MFLGQFRHSIDAKGRMTIPARFRELLQDGAFLTQGFDRNLMVLTTSSFDVIYQRVNQLSMTDQTARQLKRLIFSSAVPVEVDNAGRMLIPQFLRDVSALESEATIVGVGNYFEIWASESWQEQIDLIGDTGANAQRFSALDLSTGQS